jgi:hypothetical protein
VGQLGCNLSQRILTAAFGLVQLNELTHPLGLAAHILTPLGPKQHEPSDHDGWLTSIARGTTVAQPNSRDIFLVPDQKIQICT